MDCTGKSNPKVFCRAVEVTVRSQNWISGKRIFGPSMGLFGSQTKHRVLLTEFNRLVYCLS